MVRVRRRRHSRREFLHSKSQRWNNKNFKETLNHRLHQGSPTDDDEDDDGDDDDDDDTADDHNNNDDDDKNNQPNDPCRNAPTRKNYKWDRDGHVHFVALAVDFEIKLPRGS